MQVLHVMLHRYFCIENMIYLIFFAAEIEEIKKRMAALEKLLSSLAAESISQMKEVDRLLQLYEESVCVYLCVWNM